MQPTPNSSPLYLQIHPAVNKGTAATSSPASCIPWNQGPKASFLPKDSETRRNTKAGPHAWCLWWPCGNTEAAYTWRETYQLTLDHTAAVQLELRAAPDCGPCPLLPPTVWPSFIQSLQSLDAPIYTLLAVPLWATSSVGYRLDVF